MKASVVSRLLLAVLFVSLPARAASPPVVSNVTASQRPGTKLVDIRYDVSDADGDSQLVQVQISGDGGLSYAIPCITLSGAVGSGIALGTNKLITWNAGVDWNGQFVASTKVRVTASDGTFPAPPPGMVLIPAGTFQMGDNFNEIGPDTLPVHQVYLSNFFMDKFEATKELWLAVQIWGQGHGYTDLPAGSYVGNGHPVQSISWYSVVKWCNARSEKEGLTPCYYTDTAQTVVYRTGNTDVTNAMVNWAANGYRLPTEAEWEKAARGALYGFRYPWGNTIDGSQANYAGSGDPYASNSPETTPVGYYNGAQVPAGVDMANGYGLYDMAGNVNEWCWDRYGSTYYGDVTANSDPHGPTGSTSRVGRGGGWDTGTTGFGCAWRGILPPTYGGHTLGFRCARGL